ncbi:MAG TPA: hypothetical protein V6D14_14895 [Coleofasciculaceae cyanobacterium]
MLLTHPALGIGSKPQLATALPADIKINDVLSIVTAHGMIT